MKRSPARGGHSQLPVPKLSKGSPGNAKSIGRGYSAEDLSRLSGTNGNTSPKRRAMSPGSDRRSKELSLPPGGQPGVRYITEDMIKKCSKEDNIEMITTLNLTLSKEGGKKIKYIENLEKLKRLTSLNLSNNMIEKMEKLDKLVKLRDLNISYNSITKIEGLESLINLQTLNMTGNGIEHIPIWMGKRLKALRTFHIGKNNLQSLNELAKLKPLPDLTELTVAENPLVQLPHCRSYLVFHIRTLEVLDSRPVTERDRNTARDRFEQDEVEKLEHQLEREEAKTRRLEEETNLSLQEVSKRQAMEEDYKRRERLQMERMQELERELESKNDLLKKKTSELNKACEKHYALEQELAFHKIDSKFDSLGKSPSYHETDESGGLGESPYIGKARYKANRFAREGQMSAPNQVMMQNVSDMSSPGGAGPRRAEVSGQLQKQLDAELAEKQDKVNKTEDRLKRLTQEMQGTEKKLLQATADLKRMGDYSEKEDVKVQLRQRLARKMQMVNELRDSATQIEDEIEKTRDKLHQDKVEVAKLKGQLDRLDKNDPKYKRVYAEMVDKEQQISESNQMYGQLQQQLEIMLDTIAKETNDIKKLEAQINDDRIDQNDAIRTELDEIVGGLQTYLSNVKGQGLKRQREYESLLGEKQALKEKCKKLETELSVLDLEAANYKEMEKKLREMEVSLHEKSNMNLTLEDQLHRTRQMDTEYQDKLENTSRELQDVKRAMKEMDRKAQNEKQTLEKQLQTEKEKLQKAAKDVKVAASKQEETKKLAQQLESAKALNDTLRNQVESERQRNSEAIPLNEMRKRLKELAQNVKGGKSPIEPQHEKDILGKTFKDIQTFMHEQMNKSFKEHDQSKRKMDQAAAEIQTLRDNLKKAENKLSQQERRNKEKENKSLAETSANADEIKRLENEVQRLRNALKDLQNRAAQGRVTKIVYRPESESDKSSLNSEEKVLYDELQRELMELRRHMRSKEEDNANRLAEAETEAAMLEQAMKDQERQFEKEFSRQQEEFDLMKEKQEARMQVIAQDLDQATHVADYLQGVLDDRERQLDHELQEADMTNQMITAQEEELVRLYEILDAQREEIERLNDMLDGLSHQGLDAGPGFDDELWRLRQEVNRLKETLAMQTAYVQTMPQIQTSTGTQAQFGTQYDPPPAPGFRDVPYQGQAAGPLPRPQLSQYQGAPMSMGGVPFARSSMGTSYAQPAAGSVYPHPAGTSGIPHGGQRDVKTPPGVRPAGATERQSRSADGRVPSTSVKRPSDRVHSEENDRTSVKSHRSQGSHRSRRSAEGRRSRTGKGKSRDSATAFEPVHKPQAYKPVMNSASSQSYAGAGQPAYGPAPGFQPVSGPSRGIQTGPYIGASRGIQTGGFRPGFDGSSRPGFPGAAGTQTPGYASTQTPGYASVQTPGYAGTQTGAVPPGVGIAGTPGYVPVVAAPAQRLGYSSDRVFLPAYSTTPNVPQGRIYYPASGGILPSSGPGQAPAPPPPPPPPPPPHSVQIGPPSPGPHVTFLPLSPIASGTPVKRSRVLNDGSMTAPPSPIVAGSVGMDSGSHPRGILKNAGMAEDSYLFCNVPEHHDLEDYIAELQEKLKRLKLKISKDRDLQREAEEDNENRLVRRLRGELEERRDELEGLDLAIERQKKNLKQLRKEEKFLERERRDVKEDLEILRIQNSKFPRRRKSVDCDSDESFETRIENSRQKYLKDEIECLEKTLAKRRGQLRDADRLLKECNNDIRDAREQARDTVQKYDKASTGLENTLKESNELERRANEAGVELIKASDTLGAIRSEVKDLDRRKHKQERLLRDITQVISKRDSEFKDLDARVRSANQNLQRIQADLAAATRREKETMDSVRDAETVLGKRRAEIARMREQIESQRQELEKVDQMMGKRRTELQLLEDTTERKKAELNNVLRDAEGEVNMKQRELRDYRDQLRQFEGQKVDLMNMVKTKRGELQKLKDETATEEEVLNKLLSTLNKHKSELKHTYEMQKLEQTSLESVKAQHSQKVAELDKTQKELVVERAELEQLNSENSRKAAEVERLRQALDRDRHDIERLTIEKQTLDDRINTLVREKDLLDEGCKTLDNKSNNMKRSYKVMEEKIDTTSRQLEKLEEELRIREKEMEEANIQRNKIQKELQAMKSNAKEGKSELKSLKEHVHDAEDQLRLLEQDLRDVHRQRDDAKLETDRLNEAIRTSRMNLDDCVRQEKLKQDELQELLHNIDQKEIDYQEARKALNKVRSDAEREESKLNQLVSNANVELEKIRSDLHTKQVELESASTSVSNLKKESEHLHESEEKIAELEKHVKDLEREILDRNEEKNELAKALSRSYEEIQKLRTMSAQDHERTTKDRLQLENALHDLQEQHEQLRELYRAESGLNQELNQIQKRSTHQVTDLQNIAEDQFNRANRLTDELNKMRKDGKELRKQLLTQSQILEKELIVNEKIKLLQNRLYSDDEQLADSKLADDTDLTNQSDLNIECHLVAPQQQNNSDPEEYQSENKENIDIHGDKDDLRGKLTQEQDYLRHQLREQMERHANAMENARLQSEGTIESLRLKLNTLQEVLINAGSSNSDIKAIQELTRTRSRSQSPGRSLSAELALRDRKRSPSPGYSRHGYLAQRPRSRSRSYERMASPIFPERDTLTA